MWVSQIVSFESATSKEIGESSYIWKKYWSLKFIFKRKMSQFNRAKAFNACIVPSLTYGEQTWSLTEKNAEKLLSNTEV